MWAIQRKLNLRVLSLNETTSPATELYGRSDNSAHYSNKLYVYCQSKLEDNNKNLS